MNFTSWQFLLLFLPLTFAAFHAARGARTRQALLIAASLSFYAASGLQNLAVLVLSIAVNYAAGSILGGQRLVSTTGRRAVMWAAVACNLALLLLFKVRALQDPARNGFLSSEEILIPLALSFITFQQIGFVVACQKRSIRNPGLFDYLFFVAFFPQLVMGPIVRFDSISEQLRQGALARVQVSSIATGLALLVFALAKKVLLADQLANPVNRVFEGYAAGGVAAVEAWYGIVAFQLQIFLDFMSYAEMAIGLGLMFGVRLPINFDRPMRAVNRFDLWRRWHITFVMFMRTHVFLPLVRRARLPVAGALAVTGILSGLWHGLGWTFVVWGLVQTAILLAIHYRNKWLGTREPVGSARLVAIAVTFLVSALVGGLFRAPTLEAAGAIYAGLLPGGGTATALLGRRDWLMAGLAALVLWGIPEAQDLFRRHWRPLDPRPDPPRQATGGWLTFDFNWGWALGAALLFLIVWINLGQSGRFIYVQF